MCKHTYGAYVICHKFTVFNSQDNAIATQCPFTPECSCHMGAAHDESHNLAKKKEKKKFC